MPSLWTILCNMKKVVVTTINRNLFLNQENAINVYNFRITHFIEKHPVIEVFYEIPEMQSI